jgi:hypothetical protein
LARAYKTTAIEIVNELASSCVTARDDGKGSGPTINKIVVLTAAAKNGWSYRRILVTEGIRRQRFEFAI